MARSTTTFTEGNTAAKGHKGGGGRPPNYAKLALKEAMLATIDGESDGTSLRVLAIEKLRPLLDAVDLQGVPAPVALQTAKMILSVTDPDAMGVKRQTDNDAPLAITIEFVGAVGFDPRSTFAPASPAPRPVENLAGKEAVQRSPVRTKVRKDNPRRG